MLHRQETIECRRRPRPIAGVAQAEPQAEVGLGVVGAQRCVAPVGRDRLRAVAGAPCRQRQREPGGRQVGLGDGHRPQLLHRLGVALLADQGLAVFISGNPEGSRALPREDSAGASPAPSTRSYPGGAAPPRVLARRAPPARAHPPSGRSPAPCGSPSNGSGLCAACPARVAAACRRARVLTAQPVCPNVRRSMIPLVGSLAMGIFSALIFWATVSLGRAPGPHMR